MSGRVLFAVTAVFAMVISASCNVDRRAKSGPSVVNSNIAAPSPSPLAVTWTDFEQRLDNAGELKRAWTRFERSQKYRLATPNDVQHQPFQIWWGCEAYQGPEFLTAIVVDPSRSDPNRYGVVVLAAPESEGSKYRTYWATREENLHDCEVSGSSGSLFVTCLKGDGSRETRSLGWYKSRREFRLKPL